LCPSIRLQEKPSRRGQLSYAWLITNGAVGSGCRVWILLI
jgi:hypothetical protein